MAAFNEKELSKGEMRKLTALRKSLGNKIADEAFAKWLSEKPEAIAKADPVAQKIEEALNNYTNDKSFRLGIYGYTIKRAKKRGPEAGFLVTKNEAP